MFADMMQDWKDMSKEVICVNFVVDALTARQCQLDSILGLGGGIALQCFCAPLHFGFL